MAGCLAGLNPGASGSGSNDGDGDGGTATLALTPLGSFPVDGDENVALDMEGGFAAIIFPAGVVIDADTISMTLESTGVNYAIGERLPDADIVPSFTAVAGTATYDSDYDIDGTSYNAIVFTVTDPLARGTNYRLTLAAGVTATAADGSPLELSDDYTFEFSTPFSYTFVDSMQWSIYSKVVALPDGHIAAGGVYEDGAANRIFLTILDRTGRTLVSTLYSGEEIVPDYWIPGWSDFQLKGLAARGDAIYACGWVYIADSLILADRAWCAKFTYTLGDDSATLTLVSRGVIATNGARVGDMAIDSAGNIYVVGAVFSGGIRSFLAKLREVDTTLELVPMDGSNPLLSGEDFSDYNAFFGIDIDDEDTVYVCGILQISGAAFRSAIVTYNTELEQQTWLGEYTSFPAYTSGNLFLNLKADRANGVLYVAGFAFLGAEDNADPVLRAYSIPAMAGTHDFETEEEAGDGILIDEVNPSAPLGAQPAVFYDATLSSGGDVIAVGAFANASGYRELAVWQFRLVNGTTLESRYFATQGRDRYHVGGISIAIDTGGNVVVAGNEYQEVTLANAFRTIWKFDRHLNVVADAPPE